MGLGDTHDLLREAMGGSKPALNSLLERLRPRLVLWVTGRLSARMRALVEPEDVAQDVLVAVAQGFHRFTGSDLPAFYRWFFTVAENRIRDLVDHHGALKRQLPHPQSFSQTSPSTAASRREQVDRVMRALATLPEDQREVIILHKIEERSAKEVGAILGKTENAVRVFYCRALKALREAIGGSAAQPA